MLNQIQITINQMNSVITGNFGVPDQIQNTEKKLKLQIGDQRRLHIRKRKNA